MLDIIIDGSNTAVEDLLLEIVNQSTMASKVFDFMRKQGYRNALGSPRRAVAETLSNAFMRCLWTMGLSLKAPNTETYIPEVARKLCATPTVYRPLAYSPALKGPGW